MRRSRPLQRVLIACAMACVAAGAQAQAQVQATAQAAKPSEALAQDLQRFTAWFGGEFDNHEQVWQQKQDKVKAEEPIAHTHHVFALVPMPALGERIYYVQQSSDGDLSKVYRQRLYRLSADAASSSVKLEIFSLPDEKRFVNAHLKPELLADLLPGQLRSSPGCEVYWRYDAAQQAFAGTMVPGACSYVSTRLNKRIIVSDTLKLSESEIWINDQARDEQGGHVFGSKTDTPVKNRKVRYFTGWAFGADDQGRKLRGERALLLHNEGQTVALAYEDGTPSPYKIELARLTYQNTTAPILKLALLDNRVDKKTIYTWANTDANRIGLNLGWIQFGLTAKATQPSLGTPVP